jgi:hypothetical protein
VNGVLTPTTEKLCKGTYHLIFRRCCFSFHTSGYHLFYSRRYIFKRRIINCPDWCKSNVNMQSSLSSVITLWDNLGQRSNPYFSKKCYQTLTISFLRTFFVIFIQKTVEVVEKRSRSITPYNFTLMRLFSIKLFSSNVYQLSFPLETECFVHCLFSTRCSFLFI